MKQYFQLFFTSWALVELARSDDKIQGGTLVKNITECPFIVSIQQVNRHFCGGAIINPVWVISTCHCLANVNKTGPARPSETTLAELTFVAGIEIYVLRSKNKQIRRPKGVYWHPRCANLGRTVVVPVYDIGAAEMTEKFIFTAFVKPVALLGYNPAKYDEQTEALKKRNPECSIYGWGRTSQKDESVELKTLKVGLISEQVCLAAYQKLVSGQEYSKYSFKANRQYCTAGKNGSEAPLRGDSGGPLVCSGYLVGVLSQGRRISSRFLPDVWQGVSVMLQWFMQNRIYLCEGRDVGCRMPEPPPEIATTAQPAGFASSPLQSPASSSYLIYGMIFTLSLLLLA